jgi:ribonuclease Z
MRLAGHTVDAISIGGIETCIQLPDLDLAFDIGRCPHAAVKRSRVLLTHTHMDHAGGIAYHAATRDLYKVRPPTWYVPAVNEADLRDLVEVWRRLDKSDIPCTIVGCSPGDSLDLGKGWLARPFRSPHRVHCQGYAIVRVRHRLRPELVGLGEDEIRRRKLAGEQVSEPAETVEVAFTGDTLPEVIEAEGAVRTARLLVIECTFLDERVPVKKARESGHIHLDELLDRAELLQNEAILMTHFSARYSEAEIVRILDKRLPGPLRERVTPLLVGRSEVGQ